MKFGKRVSIIIPTLNEEKNLDELFDRIPGYIDQIIVVDGYSKDHTVDIAKKYSCHVVFDKFGKGSAMCAGARYCDGDYIVMMDADLSHKPIELDILLKGLSEGYDICMGSRFLKGGGTEDMTYLRKIGNCIFVQMVNCFFGGRYTDLCYGYRSFTKYSFDRLNLKCKGFSIETEISIKALKHKMKILEVPSFEKKRKSGKGKLRTVNDGWKILKVIISEVFR